MAAWKAALMVEKWGGTWAEQMVEQMAVRMVVR